MKDLKRIYLTLDQKLKSETHCRIIETHLRPGGDEIPYLLKSVTGICQYKMAILSSLNEIKHIEISEPSKSKYACITLFEYKGEGTGPISQVNIDRCKTINFDKLNIELNFSEIITPTKNSFNRYGFIIYNTDTYEIAKKLCIDSQNLLRIEVDLVK